MHFVYKVGHRYETSGLELAPWPSAGNAAMVYLQTNIARGTMFFLPTSSADTNNAQAGQRKRRRRNGEQVDGEREGGPYVSAGMVQVELRKVGK